MDSYQFERDVQRIADRVRKAMDDATQSARAEIGTMKDALARTEERLPQAARLDAVAQAIAVLKDVKVTAPAEIDRIIAFMGAALTAEPDP